VPCLAPGLSSDGRSSSPGHGIADIRNRGSVRQLKEGELVLRRFEVNGFLNVGLSTAVTGTIVSFVTAAVLALLAKAEGKSALQPTNATSHWLHGDKAGAVRKADLAHTAVGFGTHHASAMFWAAPFEAWLARDPQRSPLLMLRDASAVAMIAAVVDYLVVPKRLTPGWETVLSKRSIAATYVALALGLAAGGLIAQAMRETG
jgi:hypothetical protein